MDRMQNKGPMAATRKQLKYLRLLAEQSGTTFTRPVDITEASSEISRLLKLLPTDGEPARIQRNDARRERREVRDQVAGGPRDDGAAVRPHEVIGYGSEAHWRGPDDRRPRVYSRRKSAPTPPAGAVYVGRPTIYGNPFPIGKDGQEACVARYEEWLYAPEQAALREQATSELRGRDLVCWCAPETCHADILLELVNQDT
jgi:Domain of unknown function (DUF4326)